MPGKTKTSGNLTYSFLSVQTDTVVSSWLFFYSWVILELNKEVCCLFGIWVIGWNTFHYNQWKRRAKLSKNGKMIFKSCQSKRKYGFLYLFCASFLHLLQKWNCFFQNECFTCALDFISSDHSVILLVSYLDAAIAFRLGSFPPPTSTHTARGIFLTHDLDYITLPSVYLYGNYLWVGLLD